MTKLKSFYCGTTSKSVSPWNLSNLNPNGKINRYWRIGITLLFITGSLSVAVAQNAAELNRRNGFKTIKLASPIDSVKDAIFKKDFMERNEFPAKLYETVSPKYKSIGEVSVKDVKLMTYKNLIYKIIVTTDKDPRVMQSLEKSYGKSIYVVRTGTYNWKAEKLSLTFATRNNSVELIYRSYPIFKMMNEDKGKKVVAIAEDF